VPAAEPVSSAEAAALFSDLAQSPVLVLAVSGGPDSTALLVLAARWRASLRRGP
jgi:tRNA(Ile)-lysidine synthase